MNKYIFENLTVILITTCFLASIGSLIIIILSLISKNSLKKNKKYLKKIFLLRNYFWKMPLG